MNFYNFCTKYILYIQEFPEHSNGISRSLNENQLPNVAMHLSFENIKDAQNCWDGVMKDKENINNIMNFDKQYWGDHYGNFHDPFGHSWSIGCC